MNEQPHGTQLRFCWGCRCPECNSACPHGTYSGYTNWFCRCDECRHAARVYQARDRIRRKLATGKPLSPLERQVQDADEQAKIGPS